MCVWLEGVWYRICEGDTSRLGFTSILKGGTEGWGVVDDDVSIMWHIGVLKDYSGVSVVS